MGPPPLTRRTFDALVHTCCHRSANLTLLLRSRPRLFSAYETRRITRPERSPPEASTALLGWVSSVLAVSDEETHRCVGLDTFMFIRFLRMCFFITGVSSAFALVFLIPIYATGGERSSASTGYNSINMANVINGSHRLWATLVFWYGFVALVLHCFWREWLVYLPLRQRYLVEGDVDTPQEYRYTLQVESIPMMERKPERLYRYFDELFPGGVVKVNLCLNTEELEATLAAQHAARNAYEAAVAAVEMQHFDELFAGGGVKVNLCLNTEELAQHAARNANEAAVAVREASGGSVQPQKRLGGFLCCGGRKVNAIPYYEKEMARLTAEAEAAHAELACFSQELAESDTAQLTRAMRKGISIKGGVDLGMEVVGIHAKVCVMREGISIKGGGDLGMEVVGIHAKFHSIDGEPRELALARRWRHVTSATAFVTLNSLVAKQAAVQCEVSGDAFAFATRPAPEPHDVLWANVTVPAAMQRNKRTLANCLWAAGVGFWAIPVAFTQTISNLDELKKLAPWLWIPAPGTLFYEILSSYLPVSALMPLMMLLPRAITKSAVFLQVRALRSALLPRQCGASNHKLQLEVSQTPITQVIALMLLMMLVPWAITKSAVSFMRLKSASAVDLYVFKWHFGFQLANLWLVLIGGSIFEQFGALNADPASVVTTVASKHEPQTKHDWTSETSRTIKFKTPRLLIGGSIFEQFGALKKNPASVVTTVASSIPGVSQFFLNMVITSTNVFIFFLNIVITSTYAGLFMEQSRVVTIAVNALLGETCPAAAAAACARMRAILLAFSSFCIQQFSQFLHPAILTSNRRRNLLLVIACAAATAAAACASRAQFFSDKKKSQRMLNARSDPPSFDWGGTFPPIIFILLVGLVYVCIVPIIQPFCAVFFGLAYVVYKHQALHVYARPAEGGAAYFPLHQLTTLTDLPPPLLRLGLGLVLHLYTLMMSCLYTAEVVMMVYFGIKEGTRQTPMAFVVIVVTALYDTHLRRNLAHVGKTLPLRATRNSLG
ncbi:late exocytosis, associated with Golgi transport-domain-containing protein [Tribonema minus]|uniref:Late exocytosis, associated with Golgi transport-domain-containing protein n=1 Tax=Tribonema minus TaxID=303371 RepID=A0A835ZIY0_9STRA|nr:late exocytosis, associated with Golgi transport-domain-containing protein [Tribonema minus]